MSQKIERRSVVLKELRIEPQQQNDSGTSPPSIVGYASVFDSWSEELGGLFSFREKVMPGAFAKSIEQDDIRALFNHDPNFVLGRNKAGTLTLKEDEKGLLVSITPPDTQWARDLMVSMQRGDITQMSFGFVVQEDDWQEQDGADVRELRKVKLYDVSPVTYPAYPATECDVRAIFDTRQIKKQEDIAKQQTENERHKQEQEIRQQKLLELQKTFIGE